MEMLGLQEFIDIKAIINEWVNYWFVNLECQRTEIYYVYRCKKRLIFNWFQIYSQI